MAACANAALTGYLKDNYTVNSLNGSPVATLYFGSYVKGDKILVWADKKNGELFREPEKKLLYGISENLSALHYTGLSENGLYEAVINLGADSAILADSMQAAIEKSEKLYYDNCSTCHAAVKIDSFTQNHWNSIMTAMVNHAGVSETDARHISRYVALIINK